MPIGAIAGSRTYMDALDGGTWRFGDDSIPDKGVTFFAGTFVRHPVAMAACVAVLRHLEEQGPALQESLNAKTARFVGRLNAIFANAGVPTHVQHFGSVMYYKFPPDERFASLFFAHLRERGVHILEGFPCFMTTAHSEEDLAFVLRAYEESVAAMQDGGFFAPPRPEGLVAAPPPGSETVVVPLTEAQREVWLATRMGDDASCAFNESVSLALDGALDRGRLRGSPPGARRPPRRPACVVRAGRRRSARRAASRDRRAVHGPHGARRPPRGSTSSRLSSMRKPKRRSTSSRAPRCVSASSRSRRSATFSS